MRGPVQCRLEKHKGTEHRFHFSELEDAFRTEEDLDVVAVLRETIVAELTSQEREDEERLGRELEAIAVQEIGISSLAEGLDLSAVTLTTERLEAALRRAYRLGRDDMDNRHREHQAMERRHVRERLEARDRLRAAGFRS